MMILTHSNLYDFSEIGQKKQNFEHISKYVFDEIGRKRIYSLLQSDRNDKSSFNNKSLKDVPERTTKRTWKQIGFSCRWPRCVPLLSNENKKLAQTHKFWTTEDRKNVAQFDEYLISAVTFGWQDQNLALTSSNPEFSRLTGCRGAMNGGYFLGLLQDTWYP